MSVRKFDFEGVGENGTTATINTPTFDHEPTIIYGLDPADDPGEIAVFCKTCFGDCHAEGEGEDRHWVHTPPVPILDAIQMAVERMRRDYPRAMGTGVDAFRVPEAR